MTFRAKGRWPLVLALAASLLALVPTIAAVVLLAAALAVATGLVRPADRLVTFRWLAAGCQALTVIITWGLWQDRASPPLLPAAGWLPSVDLGVVLLATLAVVLVAPRAGVVAHVAVLGYAVLTDQTRLQPEVVSLALLLVGTVLPHVGPVLGQAHLATVWLWSGLHKLLSLGFFAGSAVWMYDGLPFGVPVPRERFGWVVAGTEIAAAALTVLRPTRRLGVAVALALHGFVLLVLSPLGRDWNSSVWPWNLALGAAAVAYFLPEAAPTAGRRATLAIGAVAVLLPVGFYAGVVDAYLTHNLYTDNTAAALCVPAGPCDLRFAATWDELDVPLPPEPRLYKAYFEKTCQPGERLVIHPRNTRILFGLNSTARQVECPAR